MMRILSIDDSASMRHIMKVMVEVIGATCLEARDGVEGLEILEREPHVDLILLDMEMPRMDGTHFLEVVKKDRRFASIPVIVVSSISQRQRMIEAVQQGAKQYLTKPFSREDLLVRIVEALEMEDLPQ